MYLLQQNESLFVSEAETHPHLHLGVVFDRSDDLGVRLFLRVHPANVSGDVSGARFVAVVAEWALEGADLQMVHSDVCEPTVRMRRNQGGADAAVNPDLGRPLPETPLHRSVESFHVLSSFVHSLHCESFVDGGGVYPDAARMDLAIVALGTAHWLSLAHVMAPHVAGSVSIGNGGVAQLAGRLPRWWYRSVEAATDHLLLLVFMPTSHIHHYPRGPLVLRGKVGLNLFISGVAEAAQRALEGGQVVHVVPPHVPSLLHVDSVDGHAAQSTGGLVGIGCRRRLLGIRDW